MQTSDLVNSPDILLEWSEHCRGIDSNTKPHHGRVMHLMTVRDAIASQRLAVLGTAPRDTTDAQHLEDFIAKNWAVPVIKRHIDRTESLAEVDGIAG